MKAQNKRSFLLFFLGLSLVGPSCSFKPSQDKKEGQSSRLESSLTLDSDGDLEKDEEEIKNGRNPFIADIPTFDGEFFEEMKLTTFLYNQKINKTDSVSFHVRKNIVRENGTPVEERDFLTKSSQFILEQSYLASKKSQFRVSHQVGSYTTDDVGHYAPARLNDLKIFPFSKSLYELSKTHQFEEIEIFSSNRLNYRFSKAKTYTDLVFDLYWYDEVSHEFKLIGTDFLSGIYQFNTDSTVGLKFKSTNKELVRKIALSGGRHLYIKLRDFKIIELDRFYNQILASVKSKSIPFIYFDGEIEHQSYIGRNGLGMGLNEILGLALKSDFQIHQSKIVRIGQKTEKSELLRDPFGENHLGHFKFQLLTNEIPNSPFSYTFIPGDLIVLSYQSSEAPFGFAPSYFGTKISSNEARDLKTFKIQKSNLLDLRINLRPEEVSFGISTSKLHLPCSDSATSKLCWSYSKENVTRKGIQALAIAGIINLNINGIDFNLEDLLASKDAIFRLKNSEIIEIKFKDSILLKIPESNALTISIFTRPRAHQVCEGVMICESHTNACENFLSNPPSCSNPLNGDDFKIIDKTKKSSLNLAGDAFISIEYI